MKAIIYEKYGMPEVLKVAEVSKPKPKPNEVLVDIRAISLNPAEWHLLYGNVFARPQTGLFKPKNKILGADFSGVVAEIGEAVTTAVGSFELPETLQSLVGKETRCSLLDADRDAVKSFVSENALV